MFRHGVNVNKSLVDLCSNVANLPIVVSYEVFELNAVSLAATMYYWTGRAGKTLLPVIET